MNQGKLEVVKQEMARVDVDILAISKLKWTGMGEFNSDDHYIYYCGQESHRRNGVAIIINKRVWNAVLGCNLKNDRMISVRFQGKPFKITVIQVYAPTSNTEEAEVEQLYKDLELTPGSADPGILPARVLEWVATSFSKAWKWKVKVKSLSRVRLLATPWTSAHQAPPPMGFSSQEYWSGLPSWLGHRLWLLWYWMVCLWNKQRSFCHFWDCSQVLHFELFFWLWGLLYFF